MILASENLHTEQPTGVSQRRDVISDLGGNARKFLRNKHAANTQRAYQSDAKIFTEWCHLNNPQIDPVSASASDICDFIADQADGKLSRWDWIDKAGRKGTLIDGSPLAFSSLIRRMNGVMFALNQLGRSFNSDEKGVIKELFQGIASTVCSEKKKVKGFNSSHLSHVFSTMDLTDHIDLRDRALLMLLYAGAFRRSELANLLVKNIKFMDGKGVQIKLDKAKRKANGITKSIVYGSEQCPVKYLQEYIEAAQIEDGYVFRRSNRGRKLLSSPISDTSIYKIIKKRFNDAGIEGRFGGHSGRRGFVDTALRSGKPINKVMEMTGHADIRTIQEYFDETERWKDNAGSGIY